MVTTSMINRLWQEFRSAARQFGTARSGNVLVIFAIAAIPIIGVIGAAVDYSRANAARTAMQVTSDSVALMLSKDAQTLNDTQLNQKATDYFKAMLNRPEVKNLTVTPVFTAPQAGNFKLDVTATGKVDTSFTRIFGADTMTLTATSEVLWGMKKLELAMALDNTGSMSSSSKMSNLKTAAHSLLATLKKAAKTDGDVKVAIIPFDTTVNIGTSYKDQPWFDVSCTNLGSPRNCTSTNWKNYWEGCVRDRTYPYDAQDTTPNKNTSATLYPVFDCGSLVSAMPLSYDWSALDSKIDAMTPNGNTNVTIGLVWAWHALTANAPFTEAKAPAEDLEKVIIVLTDGDNTESWKNSNDRKVTSESSINTRTSLVCDNIKAANIRIYAIRVIDGNASLLRNCATKTSMYYDVQQASELDSVFSSIAQNLANLRIAK
jgi:Flp pilus assembly protein TadG